MNRCCWTNCKHIVWLICGRDMIFPKQDFTHPTAGLSQLRKHLTLLNGKDNN